MATASIALLATRQPSGSTKAELMAPLGMQVQNAAGTAQANSLLKLE